MCSYAHPSFRIEIYNTCSGSETEVQELRIQLQMVLLIDLEDGMKKGNPVRSATLIFPMRKPCHFRLASDFSSHPGRTFLRNPHLFQLSTHIIETNPGT